MPRTDSDSTGNTTPHRIAKASASSSRLLNRNVASRDTTDSSRWSLRSSGSRHSSSVVANASTTARNTSSAGPTGDCTNEWIELTTPLRVRNVPRIDSEKVALTSTTFHTFSIPFFSCTITECR